MADPASPTTPAASIERPAAAADQSPDSQTGSEARPAGLMSAGAPGWYSLVATSFLVCEFNPLGAIGIAAGIGSTRGSSLEWALTAASFMLALSGFIYAERRASVDNNQRALEICAVITIAAGIIPCISAISIPALIAWPIGMMFLITGGSGLRAARKLGAGPPPVETESKAAETAAMHAPTGETGSTGEPLKRRHKRRRSRKRRRRQVTD
jgi:hypothetical protein